MLPRWKFFLVLCVVTMGVTAVENDVSTTTVETILSTESPTEPTESVGSVTETTGTTEEPVVDISEALEPFNKEITRRLFPVVQDLLFDPEIPHECVKSFAKIGKGMQTLEIWAIKFLDSSGLFSSGGLEGRSATFGDYDQCLSIEVPTNDGESVDFYGKYCSLYIKMPKQPLIRRLLPKFFNNTPIMKSHFDSPEQVNRLHAHRYVKGVRMAICLPSTCDGSTIEYVIKKMAGKYGIEPSVPACRSGNETAEPITNIQIFMTVLLIFMTIIIIWASIVDYRRQKSNDPKQQELSTAAEVLKAFSVYTNNKKLMNLNMDEKNKHLAVIHGIRVWCCFWVLLSHTYSLLDPTTILAPLRVLRWLHTLEFNFIIEGFYGVDIFFMLSGFLALRTIRQELGKSSPVLVGLVMIFRRYFRLVVPGLFFIGLVFYYPHLLSGPVWDEYGPVVSRTCYERWWTILTMANNYDHWADQCQPHLWYIAAEYQILVFCIAFVILLHFRQRLAMSLMWIISIVTTVITFVQTYQHDYMPYIRIETRNVEAISDMINHVQFKPYCHIASFVVGVTASHILEELRAAGYRTLSRKTRFLGWPSAFIGAFIMLIIPLPWNSGYRPSLFSSALYAALHRTIWVACIAWFICACAMRGGGALRWFFTRKIYIPISRLTFAAYLVHYPLFALRSMSARSNLDNQHFLLLKEFVANVFLSFVVGWFVYMYCEAPYHHLDQLFFKKITQKSGKKGGGTHANGNGVKTNGTSDVHIQIPHLNGTVITLERKLSSNGVSLNDDDKIMNEKNNNISSHF